VVTFDDSIGFDNIQKLTMWKGEFEPLHLEAGDVLYANTDESFHFWIGDNHQDAYIVDVGSLFWTKGLEGVLEDISELQHLYIVPTHFHAEHMQGIAPLINRTDLPQITLVLSTGLNLEFIGWFLESYGHLKEKIDNGQLDFIFADKDEWVHLGELEAKLLLSNTFEDNRLKHFITNTSPVFRDMNGNFRIFSGDLQPPALYISSSKEKYYDMFASSLGQIFDLAEIPGTSQVDYYFGVGLSYGIMMLYPWELDDESKITPK